MHICMQEDHYYTYIPALFIDWEQVRSWVVVLVSPSLLVLDWATTILELVDVTCSVLFRLSDFTSKSTDGWLTGDVEWDTSEMYIKYTLYINCFKKELSNKSTETRNEWLYYSITLWENPYFGMSKST